MNNMRIVILLLIFTMLAFCDASTSNEGLEVTNKEVKSGEQTELTCRVTSITKVWTFAWTDSNSGAVTASTDSQPGENNIQESKITLTPTQDTTYKCTVTDPTGKGKTEATLTLNVFEITNPTEVVALVGVATSLTCGVTGNTGTPSYVWYKVGQESPVYTDPGNAATSTYTITNPQFSNDGAYKCKVAIKVGDFINDGFDSTMAELIIKQLTASFGDETTVKKATDSLVCTYKGDNDVSVVVWTSPSGTIDSSKVKTTQHSDADKTIVSTYTFIGVGGKDGGDYTCTFNFNKGTITPLSKKTKVTIAVLTTLDAITINKGSLDCAFIGTYEPGTVKWYTAANQEVVTGEGSAYTITPGTWKTEDNSIKSTLSIDKSKYTDMLTFTCALTFTDTFPGSDSGLQTLTALHFREIESKSGTTYSTGSDVTLSCVFDFTKGDTGPTAVEWTQIENLAMSDDYLVDLGTNRADGKRKTTLTLKGIDNPKFAESYTCGFKYSDTEKYTDSIQVHVRVVTVDKASQYVHTNDNFKITCDFVGKETPTAVKWSHKASAEAEATPITSESTDFGLELIKDNTQAILTKSNPGSADDGEYSCAFEFTESPAVKGTAKADIVVALLQLPQHTSSPINETSGQKVVLSCTVKSEKPIDIYWYKGATQLNNAFEEVLKANVVSSELTIDSFVAADAGEYSCRLDNDGSILRVSEQRVILKIEGNSTNITTCETVGGQDYCNITVRWTPRVGKTWGLFAMIVPVLYAVVMLVVVVYVWSPWEDIKVTYKTNTRLLYVKEHVGSVKYEQIKTQIKDGKVAVKEAKQYSKFVIDGEESKIPADVKENKKKVKKQIDDKEVIVDNTTVTLAEVKTAKKQRQLLFGLITLPLPCGRLLMVSKLIIAPLFAIAWDVIDIYFDTYYFYNLERGGLIHPAIFRNTHVNNSVLGFACVGAVKCTIVAWCYLIVVYGNKDESEEHSRVVLATMAAVSTKLLLEDAPELVLEYFYVDKYIVVNPPWFLVGKDVITALIYIFPLIKIISSGVKDFKIIRKEEGSHEAYLLYIPTTLARGCMSLAMIFRIIGMIIQYMSSTVNKECFVVLDNTLLQTPFNTGCLTWCDWTILVLINLTLFSSILPVIYGIAFIVYGICC